VKYFLGPFGFQITTGFFSSKLKLPEEPKFSLHYLSEINKNSQYKFSKRNSSMLSNNFSSSESLTNRTHPKIKSKRTFQLNLTPQSLNLQPTKRNDPQITKFSQERATFLGDFSQTILKTIRSGKSTRELQFKYHEYLGSTWTGQTNKRRLNRIGKSFKNLGCLQAINFKFFDCRQMADKDLTEIG